MSFLSLKTFTELAIGWLTACAAVSLSVFSMYPSVLDTSLLPQQICLSVCLSVYNFRHSRDLYRGLQILQVGRVT